MRKKKDVTPRSQVRSALRQLWLRSRERATALKNAGYSCEACGKKRSSAKGREVSIEAHHKDGIDWDGVLDLVVRRILHHHDRLVCLCKDCHEKQHDQSG